MSYLINAVLEIPCIPWFTWNRSYFFLLFFLAFFFAMKDSFAKRVEHFYASTGV